MYPITEKNQYQTDNTNLASQLQAFVHTLQERVNAPRAPIDVSRVSVVTPQSFGNIARADH
ncbi:hypothetical protein N7456_011259 [Penicillium angulare]|uniref:Uncharacterized protein n=1 Tax=Penicillium angulare TaxID=116970 RepID=A0A9W9JZP6_9EURO|nr:hypothetical protein N7456_011259 [Penicillium angulare]